MRRAALSLLLCALAGAGCRHVEPPQEDPAQRQLADQDARDEQTLAASEASYLATVRYEPDGAPLRVKLWVGLEQPPCPPCPDPRHNACTPCQGAILYFCGRPARASRCAEPVDVLLPPGEPPQVGPYLLEGTWATGPDGSRALKTEHLSPLSAPPPG